MKNARKHIFILTSVLMVILIGLNTGCQRKKKGKGVTDIDNIGGFGEIGEFGVEGWGAERPENMRILPDVQFENIRFDYDSTQIAESERSKIENVADYLRANARVGVIAEGHCDERGSLEYNMALGERRALAVRAYLIGLGIDGAIIQTKSYGEERPLAHGHDEASWAQNRRVEFVFYNY